MGVWRFLKSYEGYMQAIFILEYFVICFSIHDTCLHTYVMMTQRRWETHTHTESKVSVDPD
jgi:hypothetical protein